MESGAGEDLVFVHLGEDPGLPQVGNQHTGPATQRDPVSIVIDQRPQLLLVHLLQVRTLGHTLPCHAEVAMDTHTQKVSPAEMMGKPEAAQAGGEHTHT